MASRAMLGHIFTCHAIFLRVMPCHEYSMPCHVRIFWEIYFLTNDQKYMPVLCQEYMLFFCLPLSIQPRLNTQQQGRAPPVWRPQPPPHPTSSPLFVLSEEPEPWLTTQWQTGKQCIVLAEDVPLWLPHRQIPCTFLRNVFRNKIL